MSAKLRTAVLVVHGIGSQRAQETVRGIVDAVWFDDDPQSKKKVWTHPERSTDDIDLVVMTTSEIDTPDKRSIDFHELYWAHLMSETKAVAVLFWLFELARKGPILKAGINGIWWCAAIFLCLLNFSIALLAVRGAALFSNVELNEPQPMVVAPFLMIFSAVVLALYVSHKHSAGRLVASLTKICAVGFFAMVLYFVIERVLPGTFDLLTDITLPTLIALIATYFLMGRPGIRAFKSVLFVSVLVFLAFLVWAWAHLQPSERTFSEILITGWRPWSLDSPWSSVVAWVIIGVYLIANAAFLQSYLGDAARYFRNSPGNVLVRREIRSLAVDTLKYLHICGLYDRIIVVAHSQGTVIAYDMLRAYFSQVCDELPSPSMLGDACKRIDDADIDPRREDPDDIKNKLREDARQVIANIVSEVSRANDRVSIAKAGEAVAPSPKAWLVTDFITLGSPLTHANYLMCQGDSYEGLKSDFDRRVREREFPTCPPMRMDGDKILSFHNPRTGNREFHHGALFGLTHWTNLYFPLRELLWGDAMGGPLKPLFGTHIRDIEVSKFKPPKDSFFAHNLYWNVKGGRTLPQIVELQKAVNLADVDKPR